MKLDSNPEFTASVIVAYARAIFAMKQDGMIGCKTVFDVAPAYLSPLSGEELRATLLYAFQLSICTKIIRPFCTIFHKYSTTIVKNFTKMKKKWYTNKVDSNVMRYFRVVVQSAERMDRLV